MMMIVRRSRHLLARVVLPFAIAAVLVVATLLMHAPLEPAAGGATQGHASAALVVLAHGTDDSGSHSGHGSTFASCAGCSDDGRSASAGVGCLLLLVFGVFALAFAGTPGQASCRRATVRTRGSRVCVAPVRRPPPSLWELSVCRT